MSHGKMNNESHACIDKFTSSYLQANERKKHPITVCVCFSVFVFHASEIRNHWSKQIELIEKSIFFAYTRMNEWITYVLSYRLYVYQLPSLSSIKSLCFFVYFVNEQKPCKCLRSINELKELKQKFFFFVSIGCVCFLLFFLQLFSMKILNSFNIHILSVFAFSFLCAVFCDSKQSLNLENTALIAPK